MPDNSEDNIDNPELKRVFPRFSIDMEVEIDFCEGGHKEINRLVKIAIGGGAVRTSKSLDTGKIVKLSIPAGTPSFEIKGEVRWVKNAGDEFELGLKFVEATGESIDGLHNLLRTVMPSSLIVGAPPDEEDLEF